MSRVLPAIATTTVPSRSLYKKAQPPRLNYTRKEVDEKVLDMLYDYAKINSEKVTLESNLIKDLKLDRLARFGLSWDLITVFDFPHVPPKNDSKNFQSGREAADYVASVLEESKRLVF
ncbi:hypothetical protein BC832DRAFT_527088 [Gaertneriomyces semiglobifer]|nr:hypothetical protein BC832DRAFT_527088 [Gaertneriomyces semiglobifer]